MKIVCLLSKGKGHLDFGGMGYLKIALELKRQGHEVIFYTTENQIPFLESQGLKCKLVKNIDWLWLYRDDFNYLEIEKDFFVGLKFIELSLQKEKPDLVLVDRLLGLANGLLDHLKIPYVSIGTPGGNWKKIDQSILPGLSAHNENGTKELFIKRLHWPYKTISAWCSSPFLNIVFMGKEFYPDHQFENTLFIDHFNYTYTENKSGIGLSLGNGTVDLPKLSSSISSASKHLKPSQKIQVFGTKKESEKLIKIVPTYLVDKIELKGYVDFKVEMQSLKYMIFSGGIGTLWHCLDNSVVPIIISGEIHDQNYNRERLIALNIAGNISDEAYKKIDPSKKFSFNSTFENALSSILRYMVHSAFCNETNSST